MDTSAPFSAPAEADWRAFSGFESASLVPKAQVEDLRRELLWLRRAHTEEREEWQRERAGLLKLLNASTTVPECKPVVDATAVQEECDRLIRRMVGLQEANWRLEQRTQALDAEVRLLQSAQSRSRTPAIPVTHFPQVSFSPRLTRQESRKELPPATVAVHHTAQAVLEEALKRTLSLELVLERKDHEIARLTAENVRLVPPPPPNSVPSSAA